MNSRCSRSLTTTTEHGENCVGDGQSAESAGDATVNEAAVWDAEEVTLIDWKGENGPQSYECHQSIRRIRKLRSYKITGWYIY